MFTKRTQFLENERPKILERFAILDYNITLKGQKFQINFKMANGNPGEIETRSLTPRCEQSKILTV